MPNTFEVTIKGRRLVFKEATRIPGALHKGHKADGLWFRCCDFRFRARDNDKMDVTESGLYDIFSFPGGATMLMLGGKYGHPDGRELTLHWVKLMLQIHETNRIYLTMHGKHTGRCGAYAKTPMLAGKADEELQELQLEDSLAIKAIFEQEIPGVEVIIIYVEADEQTDEFVYWPLTADEPVAAAA